MSAESPKYQILKAMPGLAVGDVIKDIEKGYYALHSNATVKIHYATITENPDYFRLIEPVEFTRTQMTEYAVWATKYYGIGKRNDIDSWLESKAKSVSPGVQGQTEHPGPWSQSPTTQP